MDSLMRTPWRERLVKHGYAVIVVERPGTGASFGGSDPSFEAAAREADQRQCHVGEFCLSITLCANGPHIGKSMGWRVRERPWTPPESAILGRRDNAPTRRRRRRPRRAVLPCVQS